MEQLSIAEKADILHQTAQLYLSSSLPTDYGTGQLYTATEVHALKYIIEHDGKTAAELSLDWDISRAAVSQLMKKLEAKGLVQRRPYPGSRRKMLYLPTEAGLALNRCHTQYDTQVFGETLALLEARCPQADIECCFRVLEQYIQARRLNVLLPRAGTVHSGAPPEALQLPARVTRACPCSSASAVACIHQAQCRGQCSAAA